MDDIDLAKKYKDNYRYLEFRRNLIIRYYELRLICLKIVKLKGFEYFSLCVTIANSFTLLFQTG